MVDRTKDQSAASATIEGAPTRQGLPNDVDPSLTDALDVAKALDVDPNVGLSSAEAARRLERFGPNELAGAPPVPKWRKFLAQFKDPLVYLLLAATVISVIAWFIEKANAGPGAEGGEALPFDAIVIVLILIVNAVLGYIQEAKAEAAVEALAGMTAPTTSVLRDGKGTAAFDAATAEVSVYARVAPEHKLKIVESLQRQGNIVAMTGDGVNDAPAVKTADIGVAMGITGTEVTKQSAKMILADDNFSTIVAAVREGRVIFDNIRKFLRYLLSSNVGEVFTVFFGVVLAGLLGITQPESTGVTVPLLATQLLWINLLTDAAPALAMGVDPQTEDVMNRKPRRITDRVIDASMWGDIIFVGIIMAAVTLIGMDMHLAGGLFTDRSVDALGYEAQMTEARTMGFTILVFAQLFNALASRSHLQSVFVGLFSNKWLWGAIGLSVALQLVVIYVPFLNTAFGTTPLSPMAWLECIGLAAFVLVASELRKCVLRAMAGR